MRPLAQVRVLAARDPHGGIELAQAKAPDGSLVVASGHFLPEGCSDLQEVRPAAQHRCRRSSRSSRRREAEAPWGKR